MKFLHLTIIILLIPAGTWASELVDLAREVNAYWTKRLLNCAISDHPAYLYSFPSLQQDGYIARRGAVIHLRTEAVTPIDRLNGIELRAVSFLHSDAIRVWTMAGWGEWQSGSQETALSIIKRRGKWELNGTPLPSETPSCKSIPKMALARE